MAILHPAPNSAPDVASAILATTLRKSLGMLQTIQSITSKYNPSSTTKPTIGEALPTLPPLTTTGITAQLESIGLSHSHAQDVSTTYINMADELRIKCEASFQRSLQDLASRGLLNEKEKIETEMNAWHFLYTDRTTRWVETILKHAHQSVSQQPHGTPLDLKKPAFNHEYTPLLDKYFEYNAYPSAPDREVLARKSMMTPRQIEVWFQNHRRRAKKVGKKLRRLSSDPLPLQLSLESLSETMPLFTQSKDDKKRAIEADPSDPESSDDDNLVQDPRSYYSLDSILSPPHAFPTPYPPSCDYEPFPTEAEKCTFPAPVWMRKATNVRPSRSLVDFEEFITEFATKLSIRESHSKKPRSPPDLTRKPWFAATHTVAPTAPHPAFIRSPPTDILPSLPDIQTITAPPSRLHPFRSPNPQSWSVTLVSSKQVGTPTRRKVASLPKRTPKNTSVAHRGASPTMSEASPAPSSRSLSPSSRMSSFSSNTQSCRRPSSSSSSSASSSTLATPVLASMALPDSVPSPSVSISGVDFQGMDDLFGDSTEATSPLDELPAITTFSGPMLQGKERFRFGIESSPRYLG